MVCSWGEDIGGVFFAATDRISYCDNLDVSCLTDVCSCSVVTDVLKYQEFWRSCLLLLQVNANTNLLKYKTCYKEYTKVHTLAPTSLHINQKGFSGQDSQYVHKIHKVNVYDSSRNYSDVAREC